MSENIPSKIKQLREAAGLSLEELAQAAGIEVRLLEQIERGEVSPSISILIKLARRMGVRLGTILDGIEGCAPAVTGRNRLQPTVSAPATDDQGHLNFHSLAPQKSDRNMEPFLINVEYTGCEKENFSTHEGEEFIYVLEGNIVIYYGSEKYTLGAGESIYYDSIVPHCITTPDRNSQAKVLAVTYTPY